MKTPTAKIVYLPMFYDKEKNGNECITKKEEVKRVVFVSSMSILKICLKLNLLNTMI